MHHPCQALADMMTIREKFGETKEKSFADVGLASETFADGCAEFSFALAAAQFGHDLRIAHPKGYELTKNCCGNRKRRRKKTAAVWKFQTMFIRLLMTWKSFTPKAGAAKTFTARGKGHRISREIYAPIGLLTKRKCGERTTRFLCIVCRFAAT
jgi:hypothetical protein